MDKETFNAACVAAFGENYAPKVASALFVNERTIRYWANGERQIPENLHKDVLNMLHYRIHEITKTLKSMSKIEVEIERPDGFSDEKFNAYQQHCYDELAGFFSYATVSIRQSDSGIETVTVTGTEDDERSKFTAQELLMTASMTFDYASDDD